MGAGGPSNGAEDSLPFKITVKGVPAARRCFALQTLEQ
jgi:hypothetical protein